MSLDEFPGEHNLDDEAYKKGLEESIALAMKNDCIRLLKYLQSTGSDPVGFGEMVRSKNNAYWKSVVWKEEYKKARIYVKVKIIIESYGVAF